MGQGNDGRPCFARKAMRFWVRVGTQYLSSGRFCQRHFLRSHANVCCSSAGIPYWSGPLSRAARARLPADNPVAALTCHLSCHSLPRLRFAYPQRGSRGRFAPFLSIRNGLRFRFLFAGRGLTGAVYSPPEMQVSVASGRGKWGQKRALWDVHNPAPENFAMFYTEKCIFRHRDRFLHLICFAI